MYINLVVMLLLLDACTAEQQSLTFSSHAQVCSTHRRQAWRDAYHEPLLVSPGVKSRPRVTAIAFHLHIENIPSQPFEPSGAACAGGAVRHAAGHLAGTQQAGGPAWGGREGKLAVGGKGRSHCLYSSNVHALLLRLSALYRAST